MSYEGYELWICKNGHIHEYDCYTTYEQSEWKCPTCSADVDSVHGVDETNGLPYPVGFSVEQIEDETTETCSECGHTKTLKPPRYKIERVEWYYWNGNSHYPHTSANDPDPL